MPDVDSNFQPDGYIVLYRNYSYGMETILFRSHRFGSESELGQNSDSNANKLQAGQGKLTFTEAL